MGGPALEAVAAQARKPPPGTSLRRSKAELQAVLEAEPYPGPLPTHRPAWEVPDQASLGDGERPPGAPARVRISDLYPKKYDELVRRRPHFIVRAGARTPYLPTTLIPAPTPTIARPAHLARPPPQAHPWILAASRLVRRIRLWHAAGKQGKMPSCKIAATTVHLRQSDMPVWARGAIWNCRDPEDCRPLVDAHDTHSDSLRPAVFAEWAEFIGWRDADIVHQL